MKNGKLPQKVIDKLGETLGNPIRYTSDCERLSADISKRLNEIIGVTTLKRLFGFARDVNTPRPITLDILARYAGFDSYEIMLRELGVEGDSGFESDPDIDSACLNKGDKVVFTYLPDRKVTLLYLGDSKFEVMESLGSSLQAGDCIVIPFFYLNQPLMMDNVTRGDKDLGRYVAGKVSGIKSLSIISGSTLPS